MKKILAFFVCFSLLFTFFACGDGAGNTSGGTNKPVEYGENVFSEIDFSKTVMFKTTGKSNTTKTVTDAKGEVKREEETSNEEPIYIGIERNAFGVGKIFMTPTEDSDIKRYLEEDSSIIELMADCTEEFCKILNNFIWFFGGEEFANATGECQVEIGNNSVVQLFHYFNSIKYDEKTTVKDVVEQNGLEDIMTKMFGGVSSKAFVLFVEDMAMFNMPIGMSGILDAVSPKDNQTAVEFFNELVKYYADYKVYDDFNSKGFGSLPENLEGDPLGRFIFNFDANKKVKSLQYVQTDEFFYETVDQHFGSLSVEVESGSFPDDVIMEAIRQELSHVDKNTLYDRGWGTVGYSVELVREDTNGAIYNVEYNYNIINGNVEGVTVATLTFEF